MTVIGYDYGVSVSVWGCGEVYIDIGRICVIGVFYQLDNGRKIILYQVTAYGKNVSAGWFYPVGSA